MVTQTLGLFKSDRHIHRRVTISSGKIGLKRSHLTKKRFRVEQWLNKHRQGCHIKNNSELRLDFTILSHFFPFSFQLSTAQMTRSDEDFINDVSDDEGPRSTRRHGAASASRNPVSRQTGGTDFEVTRTWEELTEGAYGTITGAVEGLLEAGKRKR